MKRLLLFILFLELILPTSPVFAQANQSSFVIGSNCANINGTPITMDVAPFIKDDRTFLPLVYVAHAMGVTDNDITWDEQTQKVILIKDGKTTIFTIGSKEAMITGISVEMDTAPIISNERTCLPIAFVATAFGSKVTWDDATKTVTSVNPEPKPTLINSKTTPAAIVTITSPNGDKYVGQLKKSREDGQGTMTYANGDIYVGAWVGGTPNGQGTMTYADGDKYVGAWVGNARSGRGIMAYANGDIYDGTWLSYTRNGQGTMTYTTGDIYVGKWADDNRTGTGTYTWADGSKYVGTFLDNEQNGSGIYYPVNGPSRSQNYDNGTLGAFPPDTTTYLTTYTPPTDPTTMSQAEKDKAIAAIKVQADKERTTAESNYKLDYKQVDAQYQYDKKSIAAYYGGKDANPFHPSACDQAENDCDARYLAVFAKLPGIKIQALQHIDQWEQSALALYQ